MLSPRSSLATDSPSSLRNSRTKRMFLAPMIGTGKLDIEIEEDVRVRAVCTTGKAIGASPKEYTWEFIFHLTGEGKATVIPDADTNQDTLTGALFDVIGDPDGYDAALTLVGTGDRVNPIAVT